MGLAKEFREFAVKGNAIDMAIGIVIGAAFGKIVTSLVNDVIMPPLGLLLGNRDLSGYRIMLKNAVLNEAGEVAVPAVTIGYGVLVNTILQFLIIAFALFMVVKAMNSLRRKEEAAKEPAA